MILKEDNGLISGGGDITCLHTSDRNGEASYTVAGLKSGDKLLVACYDFTGSSGKSTTSFDATTCSGGTLTKLSNTYEGALVASGGYCFYGTFFQCDVSSSSVTITLPYGGWMNIFKI